MRHLFLRLFAMTAIAAAGAAQAQERVLDGFNDIGAWRLVVSNQVSGSLRPVATPSGGHALCLDYNFNGVSGYVGIRRKLPIEYPDNYRLGLVLRGDSPSNDLQLKLIDASGDNVWWVNRPGFAFPKNWTTVSDRKRNIEKKPGDRARTSNCAAAQMWNSPSTTRSAVRAQCAWTA